MGTCHTQIPVNHDEVGNRSTVRRLVILAQNPNNGGEGLARTDIYY